MNSFISVAGFEKTFRYVKLFEQGLVITVMLALFTVMIGFVLGIFMEWVLFDCVYLSLP